MSSSWLSSGYQTEEQDYEAETRQGGVAKETQRCGGGAGDRIVSLLKNGSVVFRPLKILGSLKEGTVIGGAESSKPGQQGQSAKLSSHRFLPSFSSTIPALFHTLQQANYLLQKRCTAYTSPEPVNFKTLTHPLSLFQQDQGRYYILELA